MTMVVVHDEMICVNDIDIFKAAMAIQWKGNWVVPILSN